MSNTMESLTREIRAFRDARDWRQFHNPKELAVAITAEAGELLQHFVWQSPEQSEQRVRERKPELESEMADVAILTFHSGEDRRVKKAFQAGHRDGIYSAVCRDVVRPTASECRANPRSSPAKLRWAVRSGG